MGDAPKIKPGDILCPACRGEGWSMGHICHLCLGDGVISKELERDFRREWHENRVKANEFFKDMSDKEKE